MACLQENSRERGLRACPEVMDTGRTSPQPQQGAELDPSQPQPRALGHDSVWHQQIQEKWISLAAGNGSCGAVSLATEKQSAASATWSCPRGMGLHWHSAPGHARFCPKSRRVAGEFHLGNCWLCAVSIYLLPSPISQKKKKKKSTHVECRHFTDVFLDLSHK